MKNKMKNVIPLALLLSACSTNSGIIPDGKDSYIVISSSSHSFSSSSNLKISVYKEANEFCQKSDRQIETISEKTIQAGVLSDSAEAELKFKCINK
jgi:hypothetical protein